MTVRPTTSPRIRPSAMFTLLNSVSDNARYGCRIRKMRWVNDEASVVAEPETLLRPLAHLLRPTSRCEVVEIIAPSVDRR
jgi:hypothetical protein